MNSSNHHLKGRRRALAALPVRLASLALVATAALSACNEDGPGEVKLTDTDTKVSDSVDPADAGAVDATTSDATTTGTCTTSADCAAIGAFCQGGSCTAAKACSSDKACAALGGVCAKELGVCVGCTVDADCGDETSCKAYSCRPKATPCATSKECASLGQVCDKSAGSCVGCVGVDDCAKGQLCLQTVCTAPLCTDADKSCLDNETARTCKADGLGFVTTACSAKQLCKAGVCTDVVCTPASKRCEPGGAGLQVCGDDGTAWLAATACPGGQVCAEGACKAAVCTPGGGACFGDEAGTCKADGSGWTKTPCGAGMSCKVGGSDGKGAGASCVKQICSPGSSACVGSKVQTCAADGLSQSQSDDCDQPSSEGKARQCVAGACEVAGCTAGSTSCGADGKLLTCKSDGSGWEAASCGSGKTCVGSACITQTCTPGSLSCGGSTVLICNATGTDHDIGADCSKQGDACGPGVCAAGQCTVKAKDCDDGNPCTTDTCDGKTGCVHKSQDGTSCGSGKTCIAGVCKTQVCKPGATVCDGQVVATCNAQGTAYDKGQDCLAGGGKCGSGACKSGVCVVQAAGCDDGNACTVDGCDATKGCTHKSIAGACDDGDGCSENDVCDAGVCKAGKAKACVADTCKAGKCVAPEIVSFSAGRGNHLAPPAFCVATKSGDVYCWGDNKYVAGVAPNGDWSVPRKIVGVSDAIQVAATGYEAACALRKGGGVACWGRNSHGQLGANPKATSATYGSVLVSGPLANLKATQVAIYSRTGYALSSVGEVWAWGHNIFGQMGDGTTISSYFPKKSTLSGIAVQLAGVGYLSMLHVLTNTGDLYAFGENVNGVLSPTFASSFTSKPIKVMSNIVGLYSGAAPCVSKSGSVLECWGEKKQKVLQLPPKSGIESFAVGAATHRCAKATAGMVECHDFATGKWTSAPISGAVNSVEGVHGSIYCAWMISGGIECWGSSKWAKPPKW